MISQLAIITITMCDLCGNRVSIIIGQLPAVAFPFIFGGRYHSVGCTLRVYVSFFEEVLKTFAFFFLIVFYRSCFNYLNVNSSSVEVQASSRSLNNSLGRHFAQSSFICSFHQPLLPGTLLRIAAAQA